MESPGESGHPQGRLSVGEGKQCGQGFERMGLQRALGVGDRGSERERSGATIISDPVSRVDAELEPTLLTTPSLSAPFPPLPNDAHPSCSPEL